MIKSSNPNWWPKMPPATNNKWINIKQIDNKSHGTKSPQNDRMKIPDEGFNEQFNDKSQGQNHGMKHKN